MPPKSLIFHNSGCTSGTDIDVKPRYASKRSCLHSLCWFKWITWKKSGFFAEFQPFSRQGSASPVTIATTLPEVVPVLMSRNGKQTRRVQKFAKCLDLVRFDGLHDPFLGGKGGESIDTTVTLFLSQTTKAKQKSNLWAIMWEFWCVVILAIVISVFSVIVVIHSSVCCLSRSPIRFKKPYGNKSVLLVIAHPDDECMFFTPTILMLQQVVDAEIHLLCLSTGTNVEPVKLLTLSVLCFHLLSLCLLISETVFILCVCVLQEISMVKEKWEKKKWQRAAKLWA